MNKKDDDELSMDKIEDYNDNESPEKRNTVRAVIIFCLIVGAFFAYIKSTSVSDNYVGTEEKPGIDVKKSR